MAAELSKKENIYQILARLNVMFNSPEIGREVITEECGFIGTVLKESYKNKIWWTCWLYGII